MLKALELNGFKSFADRTRFEFPSGITAVVGPNGSGKSNIVDGIKWVLGSQSAKSLRGKEMTDVIFSGTRNRRQSNSAEVTLIFDNSAGTLDFDAEEVQITRRVYRSGEGEYLINRQPVRLRDIREVFAGTGVSTGAYSIIEQGKVDALLQSSARERRLIFEEAAGISRFKLKRQEAARRLERVEQNLLRLSDIVDQLDSRLHSVRSQAGRARKYKEHSDRLKLLRTQVALADWRALSAQLQDLQGQVAQKNSALDTIQQQTAESDKQLTAAENRADELQQKINDCNDQSASVRERIAQCESTQRSQLARCDELEQETERLQRQLLAMTSRAGDAEQLVAETTAELETAEAQYNELHSQVQSHQAELDLAQQALAESRTNLDEWRQRHTAVFRETTQLDNQIQTLQRQSTNAEAATDRLREQLEHAESSRVRLGEQLTQVQNALEHSESETEQAHGKLTEVQNKLRNDRQLLTRAQAELAELQGRLTGARERAIVLEELERRLDGLSAGTKEVLRLSREEPEGPFGCVRGVVADLLHVDADTASLVETALGDRANQLLIERADPSFLTMAETEWAGRTSFLRLDVPLPASAVDRIDLSQAPGVMGRADLFVETTPDLAQLARRLLGRWWFVDSLTTAMRLAGGGGRGLNYVTVVGEVVGA
ncbi:MAG: AAA family ATPase, partial [Pirellulales bacterium]|nr:AAA family ATPase [Pirellulales bacterium]